MRILVATPDIAPWSGQGELAQVVQGLCETVHAPHGAEPVDVHIIAPMYRNVWRMALKESYPPREAQPTAAIRLGERTFDVRIMELKQPPGSPNLWFVDCPALFDRSGLYADEHGRPYDDNPERVAVFCTAVLDFAHKLLGRAPDILHCHDWQTALLPVLLELRQMHYWSHARCVLTIHDLAAQGDYPRWVLQRLGLPESLGNDNLLGHGERINFLKGGITTADAVTTTSPSYAAEIRTPRYGLGLHDALSAREDGVFGILNGLDPTAWDPERFGEIPSPFSAADLAGKAACRGDLLVRFGLHLQPQDLLFVTLCPLVESAGMDVVMRALDDIAAAGGRVIVLGRGDRALEDRLMGIAARLAGSVAVHIGHNPALERDILAGADAILLPHRTQPCGTRQLQAMAFGTIPIAHATGGLRDTVIDATPDNLAAGTATGFTFPEATPEALVRAVERALDMFANQPRLWRQVLLNGMNYDTTWNVPAAEYEALYRSLLDEPM